MHRKKKQEYRCASSGYAPNTDMIFRRSYWDSRIPRDLSQEIPLSQGLAYRDFERAYVVGGLP